MQKLITTKQVAPLNNLQMKSQNKQMKTLYTVLLASVFVLASCGGSANLDPKAELEQLKKQHAEISTKIKVLEAQIAKSDTSSSNSKKIDVVVKEITAAPFTHYLDVYGKVDVDENVNVGAMMPGTVKKVYVKSGQTVKEGQLLAELDNDATLAGMEEAKTGLAFATDLFNKQKKLWDQKIGTEVQFLSAKNAKEQAEKRMATLNESLDMSRIKSPINGQVDEVSLKVGQATAPGAPAIRVVNLSGLKAKADVAESFAGKVKEGNDVVVRFPDLNTEVSGKVTFSSKVINPLNRTFFVEVDLPSKADFQPNMLAVMKIVDYQNKEALVVPVNTVQNSEEGQYVIVAENKNGNWVAAKRIVKVGYTYESNCEITEGLKAGDKIVVTGFQDLNAGDLLKM
jgi:membrane fusion protein, multidrug efflux system